MIPRHGLQLAAKNLAGETSAARGLYSLFYAWSRPAVNCTSCQRTRRKSTLAGNVNTTSNYALGRKVRQGKTERLSEQLRREMRSLPASVVVLTTASPPPDPQPLGMTLSSFTTLTLSPEPLITFNILSPSNMPPSHTLSALQSSRTFLIHMLRGNEEGAKLADRFSKGNHGEGFENRKGEVDVLRDGRLENVPRLVGSGVMAVLRCEVLIKGVYSRQTEIEGRIDVADSQDRSSEPEMGDALTDMEGGAHGLVRVGDHVLVVARVCEVIREEPADEIGKEMKMFGLAYAQRGYRFIGDEIPVKGGDQK